MSHVYFFSGKRLVKIGVSTNVRGRMSQVGEHVTLLASAPGGREIEQWIHRVLQKDRVRGEWFRPSPVLLYVAKNLRRIVAARRRTLAAPPHRVLALQSGQALRLSDELTRAFGHRGGWRVAEVAS